jgi:hemolysin D
MESPNRNDSTAPSQTELVNVSKKSTLPVPTKRSLLPSGKPLLRQTSFWSRSIIWGIVGVTSFAVIWACLADFEEAVSAQGKLEPRVDVREVQVPVGGVVQEVIVKDGRHVKRGELLLKLDSTAATAQIKSLEQIAKSLADENRFYRLTMSGNAPVASSVTLRSPALELLADNRTALVAENRVYRAQLHGSTDRTSIEEGERIAAGKSEFDSRVAAARYEIEQLEKQKSENAERTTNGRDSLEINRRIYNDLKPLVEEGGIARVQYLNQQLKVNEDTSKVVQLKREEERLNALINQAREKSRNTISTTQQDLLARIAQNQQKISQIDSQLSKQIVENEKRTHEIQSQLSQLHLTLVYQDVRSPADGTVFDLKAYRGFVANTSQPVLKIVPDDALIARIFITNKDIGFIREGMAVDVRLDSFPYSEFGDLKGKLMWIGSDALPPEQIRPFYSFPAKIALDRQYLEIRGRQIHLQSGMSLSANVKLRKRKVIQIFTELFLRNVDSLKTVR